MLIKSPLSNLSDAINRVKEAAKQQRMTLEGNEAATRAVLVDPILRELGWNTENTSMVEVERHSGADYVDYALKDQNDKVRVIIEAKRLRSDLNDKRTTESIIRYAGTYAKEIPSGAGPDIFLTDGLVWRHITNVQSGNMKTDYISFEDQSLVDCAVFLIQHLDAAIFWPDEGQRVDRLAQDVDQLKSTLATLQTELARLKGGQTSELVPPRQTSRTRPIPAAPDKIEEQAFIELARITNATGTKPSWLRLPDGTQIQVGRWKDVLRECCKFALNNNPDIPVPLRDHVGRKVRIFDLVRPPVGISFVEEKHNNQAVYIYLNYDANACILNAVHVLRQVPSAAQRTKAAVIYK